jgi:hypothetical protein
MHFTGLEQAYSSHDDWLVDLQVYPEFQSLRSELRFHSLGRRVGLIHQETHLEAITHSE